MDREEGLLEVCSRCKIFLPRRYAFFADANAQRRIEDSRSPKGATVGQAIFYGGLSILTAGVSWWLIKFTPPDQLYKMWGPNLAGEVISDLFRKPR